MDENTLNKALATECAVFCRYLLGQAASADVIAAYQRAHEIGTVTRASTKAPLDRALLRVAHSGPLLAQFADSYAAVFARSSLLRRKLVLLVAILESRGPTAAALDTAVPGSRAVWLAQIAGRVTAWAMRVALAALLIVPLRVWYSLRRRPPP